MRLKTYRASALLLLAGLLFSTPPSVYALAIANSEIAFSNLQITPSAGTVQFLDPWTAQAFAQASNSLGQREQSFNASVGGVAGAAAMVTFAQGHSTASAVNLTASAASNVNIPAGGFTASSVGLGTLFNTSFMITGVTGDVQVNFLANILGSLDVFTDLLGLRAETETIFTLLVDGVSVLFSQHLLSIGSNSADNLSFFETLFGTLLLPSNTPIFIPAQVDSESMAINVPEPSTITLLLAGLGVLAGFAKKRAKGKRLTPVNHEPMDRCQGS